MSFQTWAVAPSSPPDNGRTRATIGGFIVDYSGAVAPTAAEVQAQAAPTAAQIAANVKASAKAALQAAGEQTVQRDQAIALAAGDGDNAIRARLATLSAAFNTLASAIASPSSTLATIRTAAAGIATVNPLAQLLPGDVKQAVVNRIDTADVV